MPEGESKPSLLFEHPSRGVLRRELRAFFRDLAAEIAPGAGCLITTDEMLRELNYRYRGKDYATDVLSFPSAEGRLPIGRRFPTCRTSGDLAISMDRAIEQAAELGHGVEEELRILILHGLLHLSGLDHETDRGEMAREEMRWRKRLGLPKGLVERASA